MMDSNWKRAVAKVEQPSALPRAALRADVPIDGVLGAHDLPAPEVALGITPQPAPRVLIVDDDAETVESFARMLHLEGFTVLTARNGDEALTKADGVHAIIADFRMPLCDGLAFVRHLPADHAPVAIVTGDYFLDDDTIVELRRLGVEVFYKPLWVDDLLRITMKLVGTPRMVPMPA